MEGAHERQDEMERRFKTPEVNVRAEGSDGYMVVYTDASGQQHDLRRFPHTEIRGESRRVAHSYRDGVAEGIFRASSILSHVIGAGS